MELNSQSLHVFFVISLSLSLRPPLNLPPSLSLSSRQRGIERGWCFNHGRGAHCDVQPPLGSLIVSGQAGSADHPASGMANDSQWGRRRQRCFMYRVCVCWGAEYSGSACAHACKHIMEHRINNAQSLITAALSQIKASSSHRHTTPVATSVKHQVLLVHSECRHVHTGNYCNTVSQWFPLVLGSL